MKNIRLNGTIYGKQICLQQISKPAAKKLFITGQEIYLQSSNFNPFGIWQPAIEIKNTSTVVKEGIYNFETLVNSFEYYNCSSEQGRYTRFYKVD